MARLGLSLEGIKIQTGSGEYSIVPHGTYKVIVAKTELKETKAGGMGLTLGYQVIEGEHEGKLIKDFVNIQNSNSEAEKIGKERLATVSWATGFPNKVIDDSDDLLSLQPFEIMVDLKDDGQYKNNVIKAVLCIRDLNEKVSAPKKTPKSSSKEKPWA